MNKTELIEKLKELACQLEKNQNINENNGVLEISWFYEGKHTLETQLYFKDIANITYLIVV